MLKCPKCSFVAKCSSGLTQHLHRVHGTNKQTKLFKCSSCNAVFMSFSNLMRHRTSTHGGERAARPNPRICVECGAKFPTSRLRRYHFKMKHSVIQNARYVCARCCCSSFSNSGELSRHIRRVHDENRPFVCHACALDFLNGRCLAEHKRLEHPDKSNTYPKPKLTCARCLQTLSSRDMLRWHLNRIHLSSEKTAKCVHCSLAFLTTPELKRHCADVHEAKPTVRCELCSATLRNRKYLKQHMLNCQSDERPFSCTVCPKTFKSSGCLRRHIAVHSDTRKTFACKQCSAVYLTPTGLRLHFNTIHNTASKARYSCDKCCAAFSSKRCLLGHQLVHSEVRPYRCARCLAAFKARASIRTHLLTHTQKLGCTVCPLCGHGLKHRSSLKYHYLSSHPYVLHQEKHTCEKCASAFLTKAQLKLHEATHADERRNVCSLCAASFKHHCNLRRHEKLHSAKMPFRCAECFISCRTSSGLLCHDAAVHSGAATKRSRCTCAVCAHSSATKHALVKHIEKLHARTHGQLRCAQCERAFSNRARLFTHLRYIHKVHYLADYALHFQHNGVSAHQFEPTTDTHA